MQTLALCALIVILFVAGVVVVAAAVKHHLQLKYNNIVSRNSCSNSDNVM